MSVIDTVIPPQNFEVVRDQIGAILTAEIHNQLLMSGDYNLTLKVWRERLVTFDHTEIPAVNVMYAGAPFDSRDSKQVEGQHDYYIDCYQRSKAREEELPDLLAMVKLHRLLGICRAIIMDPKYKTLGFQSPSIASRSITRILMGDPSKMDATTSVFGRLILTVRMPEVTALINPPKIQDFLSNIRLVLTDKGYIWEGTSS